MPVAVKIRQCRHGVFTYFAHDFYVGGALERYGEFSEEEVQLLLSYLKAGDVVVEAGANIGCLTVPMARKVGETGRVFAYEPQRVIYHMLCANLAINGLMNVAAERVGLAQKAGTLFVPAVHYDAKGNFGIVELAQTGPEAVPVATMDSYNFERCELIKIDVEGMELAVLQGAGDTIERLRPVLYVENDRPEKSTELVRHLRSIGYKLFWHLPPLYNPGNFRRDPHNLYEGYVSVNMLCLPSESDLKTPLQAVIGDGNIWNA